MILTTRSAAIVAALLAAAPAAAQSYFDTGNTVPNGVVPLTGCSPGGHCTGPVTLTNPMPVTLGGSGGGASGTPTQTSISITSASTTVIAASTATSFIKLCVALSAANGVWVNWAGAAAVQAAPSEYVAPGQCDFWVKSTGYLPTSQINAVASSTVSVTLIYN